MEIQIIGIKSDPSHNAHSKDDIHYVLMNSEGQKKVVSNRTLVDWTERTGKKAFVIINKNKAYCYVRIEKNGKRSLQAFSNMNWVDALKQLPKAA